MLETGKHGTALVHKRRCPEPVGQMSMHPTPAQEVITSIKRAMEPRSANQKNLGRLLGRGDICGMNRISAGGRWEKVKKEPRYTSTNQPINM